MVRRSYDIRDQQQQQQQQYTAATASGDSQDSLICNSISKFVQDSLPPLTASNEVSETSQAQNLNELGEYIPQFNDCQLKQLNEQLRNVTFDIVTH